MWTIIAHIEKDEMHTIMRISTGSIDEKKTRINGKDKCPLLSIVCTHMH